MDGGAKMLDVVRMGDPVLRHIAAPIADPSDPAIAALAQSMIETMVAAPGVGLAAPQVGRGLRLVVMRILADRAQAVAEAPEAAQMMALINPVLEPLGPEMELGWEGCLSVPGMRGIVPRYARIGYRGFLPGGRAVEGEFSGFQARILQHETDHLDGLLYIDRIRDFSTFGFNDEIEAAMRQATEQETL